jgi:hypothetical protein
MHVWTKSVRGEGHFNRDAETVLPYLATFWSGMTESSLLSLSPHALKGLQVWSKSVGNDGHFTLHAEIFCRLYLASFRSIMTETSVLSLFPLALQPVHICSKSVINEGHLTRDDKTVFVHISPRFEGVRPKRLACRTLSIS